MFCRSLFPSSMEQQMKWPQRKKRRRKCQRYLTSGHFIGFSIILFCPSVMERLLIPNWHPTLFFGLFLGQQDIEDLDHYEMKEEEPVDGKKSEDDGIEKENLAILEKIRKNQRQDHLNVSVHSVRYLFYIFWVGWLFFFVLEKQFSAQLWHNSLEHDDCSLVRNNCILLSVYPDMPSEWAELF